MNLWIKDCSFSLETHRDLTHLVDNGDFMMSIDDKSGSDHVLLSEDSKKYFGLQFGGNYFVFNTKLVLLYTKL